VPYPTLSAARCFSSRTQVHISLPGPRINLCQSQSTSAFTVQYIGGHGPCQVVLSPFSGDLFRPQSPGVNPLWRGDKGVCPPAREGPLVPRKTAECPRPTPRFFASGSE
jgi:hypothetical protein